jgi:hypothetical protein
VSRKWPVPLVVVTALAALAWLIYDDQPPTRAPDLIGRIESFATTERGSKIWLRVKEMPPADPAVFSPQFNERARRLEGIVYVHVSAEVPVRQGSSRKVELRSGQRVRVWCEGMVKQSRPPQYVGTWLEVEFDQ